MSGHSQDVSGPAPVTPCYVFPQVAASGPEKDGAHVHPSPIRSSSESHPSLRSRGLGPFAAVAAEKKAPVRPDGSAGASGGGAAG